MADEDNRLTQVSTPIRRIRWATQRVTGHQGRRKRHAIMDRFHRRSSVANGKRRESTGAGSSDAGSTQARNDVADSSDAGDDKARTIFFNVDLPDDAKGDDDRPRAAFERNKIRTAKYTPLSFVPKNLYFQFLNIANVYFLFIIILSVSAPSRSRPPPPPPPPPTSFVARPLVARRA